MRTTRIADTRWASGVDHSGVTSPHHARTNKAVSPSNSEATLGTVAVVDGPVGMALALDLNGVPYSQAELQLQRRAHSIYRRYIRVGAPLQVNISAKLRHRIGSHVIRRRNCYRVLTDALNEIYRVMERDSFQRFLKSPLFAAFVDSIPDRDLAALGTPHWVPQSSPV